MYRNIKLLLLYRILLIGMGIFLFRYGNHVTLLLRLIINKLSGFKDVTSMLPLLLCLHSIKISEY